MGKKLALGVAITIGVAYMLHVPFPDACDCPWPTKLMSSFAKMMELVGSLNVMLGGSFAAPYRLLDPAMPKNVPGVEIISTEFAGVPVTIYRPEGFAKNGPGSAMIFLHGGGWTILSVSAYAPVTIRLAKKSGMLLVAPEYRLAPEHPFPAAYDDCLKVTEELLRRAKDFDVNPRKVVLSGDSAGGNLAVAISMELGNREKNKRNPICLANPIYPLLQIGDFQLHSYLQNAKMPILSPESVANFVLNYAGLGSNTELIPALLSNAHVDGMNDDKFFDWISEKWVPEKYKTRPAARQRSAAFSEKGDHSLSLHRKKIQDMARDRRVAPLAQDDEKLKNLPNTHIVSCEYDVLRDDSLILHERMKSLGLQVSRDHWEFGIHGLLSGYGTMEWDKLEKAVDQMLGKVTKAVEQC